MVPKRPLGNTGLFCSSVGFGGYRIVHDHEEHELALRMYLGRGGNLIDTSANYSDGSSEKLVGIVMDGISRDDVILVTKGGYIQGRNQEMARRCQFADVVPYSDDLWHCIHPDFLQTQLDASLERMKQSTIDVYLLQNPEYYVNHCAQFGAITDEVLDEYYRRIRMAFDFLESRVASGQIRFYGISSNNFGFHERDRARTDLSRCWKIAEGLTIDHHFRVIQFPLNLFEPGGVLFASHDGQTALEFCRHHGIGVLTNRPLNAFFQDKMYRIADWIRPDEVPLETDFLDNELRGLEESENQFLYHFGGSMFGEHEEGAAAYLKMIAHDVPSREHWDVVLLRYVVPPLRQWLTHSQEQYGDRPGWTDWKHSFVHHVESSIHSIERYLAYSSQHMSDHIRGLVEQAGFSSGLTLSQIAVQLIRQLPGVSSVLVGMRRRSYVEDILSLREMEGVDPEKILRDMQTQSGEAEWLT